jgi:hypothetical protein
VKSATANFKNYLQKDQYNHHKKSKFPGSPKASHQKNSLITQNNKTSIKSIIQIPYLQKNKENKKRETKSKEGCRKQK